MAALLGNLVIIWHIRRSWHNNSPVDDLGRYLFCLYQFPTINLQWTHALFHIFSRLIIFYKRFLCLFYSIIPSSLDFRPMSNILRTIEISPSSVNNIEIISMHHLFINASTSAVTVLGFRVIRDGFALHDTVISDHLLAFLAKVGATTSHVDIFV